MAAAASASSSGAAPEPLVGIPELMEKAKTYATGTWESSVHHITVGGVTVTVTGALYAIISHLYSYLTTANITFILDVLATALGTTVDLLLPWMTPEVIILLLLASTLGATIEPITVAIAVSSTTDESVRAVRVEQVRQAVAYMKMPGHDVYKVAGTLFGKVSAAAVAAGLKDKAIDAMASAGSAMASGAAATGAYVREFIVGPPDLVKLRGDILRLRRAIYIYTEAMKAMNVADEFTEDVLKLRENAHYLLGQIVTELGKLNADGITDEKIESYVGKGLPGLTGLGVEVGTFADAAGKSLKSVGTSVIHTVRENFKGVMRRVFHGDIAGKLATEPENPLTEPALEVDSMIQTFKGLGVEPPPPQPKFSPEKGYMVHKRYTINLKRIATETGIPYPTHKKIRGKSQKLSDVEIAERLKSQIESIIRIKPRAMDASSTELEEIQTLERNLQKLNTFINISKEGSSASGSAGRHTKRKHKKRHSKKSVRRHRRKKTVSHRRSKRTHNRRRTNRRTTKRSKK